MPRGVIRTERKPSRRATKKPVVDYKQYYKLVFRGYTDDDKVSRKDDSKLQEFDAVCKSDDLFGVFQTGVVMVDVDHESNANLIQRMLDDCGVSYLYQKTTRGLHFFFYHGKWTKVLKDRSHITSAVGIEVDYKCYSVDGTKLSKTLEDGTVQARPLLASPNWNDDLVDIPHFLVPVHDDKNFKELDCRNETFYTYILTLLRYGLDKEQTKHTIKLINNYVLNKPLGDRELNVILRDEAFPSNNEIFIFKHGEEKTAKLDYELFARYLIDTYNICRIEKTDYIYDNGVYRVFNERLLDKVVIGVLKNTTINMRKEVMRYIKALMPVKPLKRTNAILFKNGVLDLDTKELRGINDNDIFFNRIETEYNPQADFDGVVDGFFNTISCGDIEVKELFFETIGYCMLWGNRYQKFFWLDGEGSNGKGTLLDLLAYTVGEENVTHLSMKGLTDRFGLNSIRHALINISGDESISYVERCEILKNLTGGDTVKVESKGKDHEEMKFGGILIFASNGIPRFGDTSVGLNRRIVAIPMLKSFEEDGDKDVNFKDTLLTQKAAEYLVKISIERLYRVLEKGFTKSIKAEERKQAFIKDNNPILQFLEDYEIKPDVNTKEVYLAYRVWCEENGITGIMSSYSFSRSLTKQGYERKDKKDKNRKKYYVYVKESQLRVLSRG